MVFKIDNSSDAKAIVSTHEVTSLDLQISASSNLDMT